MLSKNDRLTTRQFEKNFRSSRRFLCGQFIFLYSHARGHSKMAVVVGKKTIKLAVTRNRIRRQIYEIFRLHGKKLFPKHTIICLYKGGTIFQDTEGLKNALDKLSKKLTY